MTQFFFGAKIEALAQAASAAAGVDQADGVGIEDACNIERAAISDRHRHLLSLNEFADNRRGATYDIMGAMDTAKIVDRWALHLTPGCTG